MNINIIIQARVNSRRLPGKVLLDIKNQKILEHVYNSLINIKKIKNIIIATSKNKSDDAIFNFCKLNKYKVFRGSLNNVYERLTSAAKHYNSDYIVRISADSPLIDHKIIQNVINKIQISKFDIITNIFPRSYPKGHTFEFISRNLLEKNLKKIRSKSDKEHVTKYFYRNYKKFKICNIRNKNEDLSSYNFCVDTKKDLERIMFIMQKMKKSDTKKLIKLYNEFEN